LAEGLGERWEKLSSGTSLFFQEDLLAGMESPKFSLHPKRLSVFHRGPTSGIFPEFGEPILIRGTYIFSFRAPSSPHLGCVGSPTRLSLQHSLGSKTFRVIWITPLFLQDCCSLPEKRSTRRTPFPHCVPEDGGILGPPQCVTGRL